MFRPLDVDLLFPIQDEPSARLMRVKAECLYRAGVISRAQMKIVVARAASFERKPGSLVGKKAPSRGPVHG